MSPWGSFLQIHYLEHCPITAYVIATNTFVGSPFSLVCIDCEDSPSLALYYKYGEKSVFVPWPLLVCEKERGMRFVYYFYVNLVQILSMFP